MKRWTIAALAAAAVLYVLACRHDVYDLTSPPGLSWHVLLRKAYSIVAFALVGYLGRRALGENGRRRIVLPCIIGVTLYSALIEIGQFIVGSKEGLGWNAFDTLCGTLGGAVAASDRLLGQLRKRS